MPNARWWKSFYAQERSTLDVDRLLDSAPVLAFPKDGALLFPHTLLAKSGSMVASVALAAARTRRRVLALGVLHGARECDQEEVRRARDGDPQARKKLRGIHDPLGFAAEEFSLDGFRYLYGHACLREQVPPKLSERFPFLAGDRPGDLPGLEDLERLAQDSVVVATTDPLHHGVGYGTSEVRDEVLPETTAFARERIDEQLAALARADFTKFGRLCTRDSSDFRDVGPVLAHLLPGATWSLEDLTLVDYSEILAAPKPTWVAAGRMRVDRSSAIPFPPG